MVAKIINIGGGDLDDFSLSPSTIQRQSSNEIKEKAKLIRDEQKVMLKEKKLMLHFDGKQVQDLTDGVVATHERCSVLVSSPTLESDVLLGVPKLTSSAGIHQVEGVMELLEEWGIEENIFSVCCDSTAAQTGRYNGAMTLLEKKLEQTIVWIVCRRHIIELHAKHAMITITGSTTAPYEPLFKRFQDNWNSISENASQALANNMLKRFDWSAYRGTFIGLRAEEVLQFCQRALTLDTFTRGDYKNLCSLTVLYLGGEIPGFKFYRPGAMHNARFMAKGIYLAMLALLQGVVTFLTPEDKENINRLIIFSSFFFVPWFLQSSRPKKAPSNDLMAYKSMKEFCKHDKQIAIEVGKSVLRHGWYLSEKLAVLAIVDEDLEDSIRKKMAAKLLVSSVPEKFSSGYPDIPEFSGLSDIADAVGPDSWFLLKVADVGGEFLDKPVPEWIREPSYQKLKDFICKMSVVNDVSERGVKLIQEYVDSAHDEDLRQNILTVSKEIKSKVNSRNTTKESC